MKIFALFYFGAGAWMTRIFLSALSAPSAPYFLLIPKLLAEIFETAVGQDGDNDTFF